MGADNFFKLVVSKAARGGTDTTINDLGISMTLPELRGKTIAIDAMFMLYVSCTASMIAAKAREGDDDNTGGRMDLKIISNKILQFRKAGIKQLWVFDAPEANPLKAAENARRNAQGKAARDRGDEVAGFRVTSKLVNELKKILQLSGTAYLEVPPGIEGEQYGAWMTSGDESSRLCYAMISGDSDVLIFGGTLLRYEKGGKYRLFELDTILNTAKIAHETLVKASVLLGTDFAPGTRLIGPKSAITKAPLTELTTVQDRAVNYFLERSRLTKAPPIVENDPDIPELIDYLVEFGFNRDLLTKNWAPPKSKAAK